MARGVEQASFTFAFGTGSTPSASPTAFYSPARTNGSEAILITVASSDGATLVLKPMVFAWQATPLLNRTGDYRNGQKGAIIELFGWPVTDSFPLR